MADIKKKVLKTIKALDEDSESKRQCTIEIVQYNDYPPQLVKQEYYLDKETEDWMPGKFKGFTYEDLKFLKKEGNLELLLKKLKPKREDD